MAAVTAEQQQENRAPAKFRDYSSYVQPLVFLLVGVLVPTIVTSFPALEDRWMPLTTMVLCAIFVMFTLGLNIVVGYAGLLDLGYVAFFLFGAYTAAWLMSDFFYQIDSAASTCGAPPSPTGDPASTSRSGSWCPSPALVAAIAGVIIGAPTLRLKSDYLALVTLGFGEILPQVFRNGDVDQGLQPLERHQGHRSGERARHDWLSWTGIVQDRRSTSSTTRRATT